MEWFKITVTIIIIIIMLLPMRKQQALRIKTGMQAEREDSVCFESLPVSQDLGCTVIRDPSGGRTVHCSVSYPLGQPGPR